MTVGVVGAGRMGTALARALTEAGERPLVCSGRLPAGAARCPVVTADEVWRHSDTVLLAVPFPAALALMSGPPGHCGAGRTLIDSTNPGFHREPVVPHGLSGGELIAAAAPTWQVAKAFNTVAAEQLAACRMGGDPVSVPIAGATAAKPDAFHLARRFGFAPLDAGGITGSRELEALAVLLARISDAQGLHGRIGVRIGQLDGAPPVAVPAGYRPLRAMP